MENNTASLKTMVALLLSLLTMLLSAVAAPPLERSKHPESASFRVHVHPLLTRHGCTLGACHGSSAGRGGLHLSLLGGNPAADFETIVDGSNGRYVTGSSPDETLLLMKASGQLNHGGGVRLRRGSAEYATLRNWMTAGMPKPSNGERVSSIRAISHVNVLFPGTTTQVHVTAETSPKRTFDVTSLAIFDALDDGTADISADGIITALRPGVARFMVRYGGQTVALAITVPLTKTKATVLKNPAIHVIDRAANTTYALLNARPAPRASEAALLRRLHFDVTGKAPDAEHEALFSIAYSSTPALQRYIQMLLKTPIANKRWTRVLLDALRVDSARVGSNSAARLASFLERGIETDAPFDRMISELLKGDTAGMDHPGTGYWMTFRDPRDLAEFTAQSLFGKKIACARCHQHPYDRWSISDNVAFATLFAGIRVSENGIRKDPLNTIPHPETGATLPGRLLGKAAPSHPDTPSQETLASSVLGNRDLATLIVNRTWKELFGQGLVEPVDDIRPGNPSRYPTLLTNLTDAFINNGMRLKWLIATIVTSKTYQLRASSQPERFREDHLLNHARRRLTAEMLDDLITHMTAAVNPAAPNGSLQQLDHRVPNPTLDALDRCQRDGRSPDVSIDSEGLVSALHRLSAPTIQKRIQTGADTLSKGDSSLDILTRQLFQRALTRPLTGVEWNIMQKMQGKQQRKQAIEDTLWVIVNHPEFGVRP